MDTIEIRASGRGSPSYVGVNFARARYKNNPFPRPSLSDRKKYPLTVIAFRLLRQFRLVNVVLPFRHFGCTRISHTGRTISSRDRRSRCQGEGKGAQNDETEWLVWHRPAEIPKSPKTARSTSTAAPRDVQPLASSLTKMAAPANNRKQFPVSRAAALRMSSARHVYYSARDVIAAAVPAARMRLRLRASATRASNVLCSALLLLVDVSQTNISFYANFHIFSIFPKMTETREEQKIARNTKWQKPIFLKSLQYFKSFVNASKLLFPERKAKQKRYERGNYKSLLDVKSRIKNIIYM